MNDAPAIARGVTPTRMVDPVRSGESADRSVAGDRRLGYLALVAELVFTVGYEGRDVGALATRLREAQVTRVLDVRASARSARPGFSRGPLSRALERAGFEYRHLPEAGNPFRADAASDLAGALARFRAHLDGHPEIVSAVVAAVAGVRAALLCAEANPARCHRSVLAQALAAARPGMTVVHL